MIRYRTWESRGKKRTIRLYQAWVQMRVRVNNTGRPQYKDYGGRGIRICGEWDDFMAFRTWALSAGYRKGLTLDRVDNDGPYSPNNCRWTTRAEQNRNQRTTRFIQYRGTTDTLSGWSRRFGINSGTLHQRIDRMGERNAMTLSATLAEPIIREAMKDA